MKNKFQIFAAFLLVICVMACSPALVRMYNVQDETIPSGLTLDQVKKAINIGAAAAGWSTEDLSLGSMEATYNIRVHTVIVTISYTERAYSIDYKKSYEMKVYCTDEDKEQKRSIKVTDGGGACPGVKQPAYIHPKYQEWIEALNRGIHGALENI